jgi:hypothetical protein
MSGYNGSEFEWPRTFFWMKYLKMFEKPWAVTCTPESGQV